MPRHCGGRSILTQQFLPVFLVRLRLPGRTGRSQGFPDRLETVPDRACPFVFSFHRQRRVGLHAPVGRGLQETRRGRAEIDLPAALDDVVEPACLKTGNVVSKKPITINYWRVSPLGDQGCSGHGELPCHLTQGQNLTHIYTDVPDDTVSHANIIMTLRTAFSNSSCRFGPEGDDGTMAGASDGLRQSRHRRTRLRLDRCRLRADVFTQTGCSKRFTHSPRIKPSAKAKPGRQATSSRAGRPVSFHGYRSRRRDRHLTPSSADDRGVRTRHDRSA